MAYTDLLSQI